MPGEASINRLSSSRGNPQTETAPTACAETLYNSMKGIPRNSPGSTNFTTWRRPSRSDVWRQTRPSDRPNTVAAESRSEKIICRGAKDL